VVSAALERIANIVGPRGVVAPDDAAPLLRDERGLYRGAAALVVRPESTDQCAAVVRACHDARIGVVPQGGNTSYCGGATPFDCARREILLSLSRLNRVREVDTVGFTLVAEAGVVLARAQSAAREHGLLFPLSMGSEGSAQIGGALSTNAGGLAVLRYGTMRELVLGLEVVLPNGDVCRIPATPRSATGPSLRELFLGSEGTLGIVTEATLRIFPAPERRACSAWTFDGMAAALEAVRRIVRVGWRPAVVRLYDAFESQWHFKQWVPEGRCALLLLSEGPAALVSAEEAACTATARDAGGTPVGTAPVEHWLERRNTVPSWDHFLDQQMMVDTIEVSAPWDRVAALYDGVVAALKPRPGMLVASAHSSHSYRQGTNLYITFAVKPERFADAEEAYRGAWAAVMDATLAAGGSIAHHHGIGRMRVPWLERELGTAYPILRVLKKALDPDGLMNPGVLLPA
jgi:alkyldihydroxyacetonephosphate synthase